MDVTDRWEIATAALHQTPWKKGKNLDRGVEGKRESVVSPPEGIIIINPSCMRIYVYISVIYGISTACLVLDFFVYVGCVGEYKPFFNAAPLHLLSCGEHSLGTLPRQEIRYEGPRYNQPKTSAGLRASSLARISPESAIRRVPVFLLFLLLLFFFIVIIIDVSFCGLLFLFHFYSHHVLQRGRITGRNQLFLAKYKSLDI